MSKMSNWNTRTRCTSTNSSRISHGIVQEPSSCLDWLPLVLILDSEDIFDMGSREPSKGKRKRSEDPRRGRDCIWHKARQYVKWHEASCVTIQYEQGMSSLGNDIQMDGKKCFSTCVSAKRRTNVGSAKVLKVIFSALS